MRRIFPYLITTLGLLGFLTGLAMITRKEKQLSVKSDPAITYQTTTALSRPVVNFNDAMGIGLLFSGAGLAAFGFHRLQKERRSTQLHSITFDFSKGGSDDQHLNESPGNTKNNLLNIKMK
jgi:hypothetical protein